MTKQGKLTVPASEVRDFGTSEPRLLGRCVDCDGYGYENYHNSARRDFRPGPDCETCNGTGDGPTWEMALIGGTHRDCDLIAKCNAEVIREELARVDPEGTAHDVMHCGHWAVGWYDHLIVDPSHAGVMQVLAECAEALADYPILSDDRHSAMECEAHDAGECDEHCSLCESAHQEGEDCGKTYCDRCEDLRNEDSDDDSEGKRPTTDIPRECGR